MPNINFKNNSKQTMKKIIFALLLAGTSVASAFAQTTSPITDETQMTKKVGGAVMTFEATEINYGNIAQGSDPLRKFKFKNTGTEPLTITNAQGSCGCTVPSYKKEPIMPGETGEIEVRYDTQRLGPFQKAVTLTTNESPTPRVLLIKGDVYEAKFSNGTPMIAPATVTVPK